MKRLFKLTAIAFMSLFCSMVFADTTANDSMQPTATNPSMMPAQGTPMGKPAMTTTSNTDSTLVSNVNEKISQDTMLNGAVITVTAKKGIIVLKGTVENKGQVKELIKVVKSVDGVKKVKTVIKVSKK